MSEKNQKERLQAENRPLNQSNTVIDTNIEATQAQSEELKKFELKEDVIESPKESEKVKETVYTGEGTTGNRETTSSSEADHQPQFTLSSKAKWFKNLVLGLFFIWLATYLITGGTSTTYKYDESIVNKRIEKSVKAGTVFAKVDSGLSPMDYEVAINDSQGSMTLDIWDFAAEDGDYVQVLVDGKELGPAFMIKHKPERVTVPAKGIIQVKGVRDGGGGITYALLFERTGETYFNMAPVGGNNTYTLKTR